MQPYKRSLTEYADITGLLACCDHNEVIALAMLAGADLGGSDEFGYRCHPNAMLRMSRSRAAADFLIGCDIPLTSQVTT
ncbi:hypothetical protein CWO91_16705 [Bradyrhizobium genosp. SA-3]|uniref:hypothetical protein n=1 Tax=Bradyrhizobium genosp. SA-3 TaxID=508868 RepID=UPI0010288C8C|nr:hypothetical protein [Bradyrhizobium genosp. SA-3]RZN09668.1 hypothetical protein CWO91_16705 [Bradyrhizobium genosp. SA-3]